MQDKLKDIGLDVLLNNAGVMALRDEATGDGFDIQMQTNHLSHFLLTSEVLPLLELAANKNGQARVVNMTSIARNQGFPLQEKYFQKNGGNLGGNWACCFGGPNWARYSQTKSANLAFTYALKDKLGQDSKIKVLAAHPGVCATNMQVTSNKHGGMSGCLSKLSVNMSAEDGAQGALTCVLGADVKTGEFYGPGPGAMAMSGPARLLAEDVNADTNARELLWKVSEEAIGKSFFTEQAAATSKEEETKQAE